MPENRYYVVADRGMWRIKFEDEEYGPFLTHDDAMGFAYEGLRKLRQQGERGHVCAVE